MKFILTDLGNPVATPRKIFALFATITAAPQSADGADDNGRFVKTDSNDVNETDLDTPDDTNDPTGAETVEWRKRQHRIAMLRKERAYNLTGRGYVNGIVLLEINRITDLPPEQNGTFWVSCVGQKLNF